MELIGNFHDPDILELGGGRRPLFSEKDIPTNVNTYRVNDISQKELDLLPSYYKKALFDVCEKTSGYEEKYDLIFSKMLAEHVSNGNKMHQNIYRMLKPGGIALQFHPKLYATPQTLDEDVFAPVPAAPGCPRREAQCAACRFGASASDRRPTLGGAGSTRCRGCSSA